MNKKAKELGEWYLQLAENDNGAKYKNSEDIWYECVHNSHYPTLNSYLDEFKINLPEPFECYVWLDVLSKTLDGPSFDTTEEALNWSEHFPQSRYELIKVRKVTDED